MPVADELPFCMLKPFSRRKKARLPLPRSSEPRRPQRLFEMAPFSIEMRLPSCPTLPALVLR
ncbi:hypothetical protein D3C78_1832840 [compost metagenome]